MQRRSAETLRIVEKLAQQAYEYHEEETQKQLMTYLKEQELESPGGQKITWDNVGGATQKLWRTMVINLIIEYEQNGTNDAES